MKIDLNADIGEGFGADAGLLEVVSSANVGCGVHSGDFALTERTLEMCRRARVTAGAHPGYPDRAHFGRVGDVAIPHEVLRQSLMEQVLGVRGRVAYIKPHGGFYNDSARGGFAGFLLGEILGVTRLPLMGLAGSEHEHVAFRARVPFLAEGFVDRRYDKHGHLVNRKVEGAVLESKEEKIAQAIALAKSGGVDSLCLHGDGDDAVAVALAIRSALEREGFEVGAWLH